VPTSAEQLLQYWDLCEAGPSVHTILVLATGGGLPLDEYLQLIRWWRTPFRNEYISQGPRHGSAALELPLFKRQVGSLESNNPSAAGRRPPSFQLRTTAGTEIPPTQVHLYR